MEYKSIKYLGNVLLQSVALVCITLITLRYNHDLKLISLIFIGQIIGINMKGVLDLRGVKNAKEEG